MEITPTLLAKIIANQKAEITEYEVYRRLCKVIKNQNDRKLLEGICDKELKHYSYWKKFSKIDVEPDKMMVNIYFFFARF